MTAFVINILSIRWPCRALRETISFLALSSLALSLSLLTKLTQAQLFRDLPYESLRTFEFVATRLILFIYLIHAEAEKNKHLRYLKAK